MALEPAERFASAAELRAALAPLQDRSPEACRQQLGRLLATAFAEERATLAEVARRGLAPEATDSAPPADLEPEAAAPPSISTDSVLRPFQTALVRGARERGAAVPRLLVLGALAGLLGFGGFRLLAPAPPATPLPPAAAAPAAPALFEQPAPADPGATIEPTPPPEPAAIVAPPPAAEVSAALPAPPAPRPRVRRSRSAASRARVGDLPSAPEGRGSAFDLPSAQSLPPAPRARLRPLDVESPYLP